MTNMYSSGESGAGTQGLTDAPAGARAGRLGAKDVVFFVIAAAAPLGFAVGSTPLAIGRGGIGTAGMFLVVGVLLAIFAVGYTAMTRFVPNAGALFSYIAAGLGRPLGLGTAFVAVLAYAIAATGAIGPFAVFASQALASMTGVQTSWVPWAFGALAAMGVLGVLNVELNIRVLGVIMVVEVVVLIVLSVAIVFAGGAEGLSLQPFRPDTVVGGEIGVVLLFVFAAFAGFEATALFREEVRNPVATVRKATFASIGLIAVFQALVTWAIVQGFGSSAVAVANEKPTEMFTMAASQYVGTGFADVITLLVVGSWFASILAFHNATARYLYALGRDRAINPVFAKKSKRSGSVWVASLAHTLFSAIVLLFCVWQGLDPYLDLFIVGSVPVAVSIPAMELLTAISIIAFFWRDSRGVSWWEGKVAPAISAVALAVFVYFVLSNLPMFTGREGAINWILPSINLVALALGISRALWMRRHRPAEYQLIGHWGER
ncbi:APC family permease [Ensifer sp. HO-A22]|uniref:APC family permease n=1 Tax=Ensifer oleiphilus TaxID=2742698 RepID=A0A7Y6UN76_9HYPH|nr:APC family permease [Ensifer oleiphilus]NVD39990.1 APC family permease [Ensifer oleiphilus]